MIKETSAYRNLKQLIQKSFDFGVVVCHAVPALKLQMNLLDQGKLTKLPEPDYYKINLTSELRSQANGYKNSLATYLYLSSFSFFENYLGSAMKEILNIYVTPSDMTNVSQRMVDNHNVKPKKILKGSYDPRHLQRYDKNSKLLRDQNYLEPEKLVMIIAIENLLKAVEDLKANQIPDFLKNTLRMDFSEDDKNSFGTFRALRNEIAHGDNPIVTMSTLKKMNRFLKGLAFRIDQHLIEHYVEIPNYRKLQA